MNAIITLCHFCELHGPRILFCTQPFHPQETDTSAPAEGDAQRRVRSPSGGSSASDPQTPTPMSSSLHSYKHDLCEGCYSVQHGYVSHEEDAQVSYVSSQHPHHREVFSMIRQACLRSLSCEVCPGREGPIFFGDDQQGHVLSYTFYIKDSQARGFQRWYSILVFMMDKIYLLNSWPFLVPHLRIVTEYLQEKAKKVYEEEQIKCPQRSFRFASSINPGNFILQRGGNKPARSLVELTDYKHVFKTLHVSFVWILKACGNRITETLLEGPPTEDSIIDMEKLEETEEGFVKLFSRKINDSEQEEDSEPETSITNLDVGDLTLDSESGMQVCRNLRHLMKILGTQKFHIVAHHVIIGNQIIVRSDQKSLVKSIITALKTLLPKGCCRVISYSSTYEESWKCNFLGLPSTVALPEHISASEMFLLLDIVLLPPNLDLPPPGDGDFSKYKFNLSSPVTLPFKAPNILTKMELALKNEKLADQVVEQCLVCQREEWMNKVKVLFKFTKAGGGRSEEDTKKLLEVVGALEEDKQLLKFWMTGLSVQYRTHILAASKSQQGQ